MRHIRFSFIDFCNILKSSTNHIFLLSVKARYFEKQFELAYITKLPMFLHMREAAADFCEIVEKNKDR